MTKYDVVYWWQGGTAHGRWREAKIPLGCDIQDTLDGVRRMGYVAHPGLRSVGAPEGPPSELL